MKILILFIFLALNPINAQASSLSDSLLKTNRITDRSKNMISQQPVLVQLCQSAVITQGSHTFCGFNPSASASINYQQGISGADIRFLSTSASRVPIVYQSLRSSSWVKKLDLASSQAAFRVSQIQNTHSELNQLTDDYHERIAPQAIHQTTEIIQESFSSADLSAKILNAIPLQSEDLSEHYNFSFPQTSSSHALKNYLDTSTLPTFEQVETITAALNIPSLIPLQDREKIRQTYDQWIDHDQLLKEAVLSAQSYHLRNKVSQQLKSQTSSPEGNAVRKQINRELITFRDGEISNSPEKMNGALGAMALTLAADHAFSNHSMEDGESLLKQASIVLDMTLGVIPLTASAWEIGQIISGIVTGYDSTGKRMTSGDYAIRGFSAILGAIPGGAYIGKIAGISFTKTLIEGAALVRNSGTGKRLAILAKGDINLIEHSTLVAEKISHGNLDHNVLDQTKSWITALEESPGAKQLAEHLQSAKVPAIDVKNIIASFKNIEVIRVRNPITVFRWHSDSIHAQKLGRFVSEALLLNPLEARKQLAIPPENSMKFLDEYKIANDTIIAKGITNSAFNQPGGSPQIFIVDNPIDSLKWQRRIIE